MAVFQWDASLTHCAVTMALKLPTQFFTNVIYYSIIIYYVFSVCDHDHYEKCQNIHDRDIHFFNQKLDKHGSALQLIIFQLFDHIKVIHIQ